MDLTNLVAEARTMGIELGAEQIDALSGFGDALYQRNEFMNLTRVPYEECWSRHFLDSLLVSQLLGAGSTLVDVGSGPGFPSWPLACARADLTVTALDGSNKGLAFLREHPLPNLQVVQCRAEDWDRREAFDVVTGRALAPVAVQLELCAPWVKVGGTVVPFRTPTDIETVRAFPAKLLGLTLEETVTKSLPNGAGERLFPVFRKRSPTPPRYPRKWAEIKSKPLMVR